MVLVASGCAAIVGADGYDVDKGSGGSTTSSSGGSTTSGSGGSTTSGTGGSTGGSGGAGGSTPTSGESICTGNTCPTGLACQTPTYGPPGICVSGCTLQTDCDAQHICVGDTANNLPGSCFKKCTVANSAACGTGLICVPHATQDDDPLCFPVGWVNNRGIGDDCVVDAQCTSNSCRNKPNGWCTKPCGTADPDCAHDATEFSNRTGELNWCVTTAGSLTCVPGCDVDPTVCETYYPGTTCKGITDIRGSAQFACLP